jgi:hypothetical protein
MGKWAGHLVARAADSMRFAVLLGCEMYPTCEASTVVVCAPMRSARNRCATGEMALSWAEIWYQLGIVFHAGSPDCSSRDAAADPPHGRDSAPGCREGRSAAKIRWNRAGSMVTSTPPG